MAFAAPVAHAQVEEGAQEPAANGNDTAGGVGDAGAEQEATGFEDDAGQVYGASIILAIAAIGVVIAVVLVKQHWRTRGRP